LQLRGEGKSWLTWRAEAFLVVGVGCNLGRGLPARAPLLLGWGLCVDLRAAIGYSMICLLLNPKALHKVLFHVEPHFTYTEGRYKHQ
jgi:hypothetical protein